MRGEIVSLPPHCNCIASLLRLTSQVKGSFCVRGQSSNCELKQSSQFPERHHLIEQSSAVFIISNEQKPKLLQCEQFVVIQCFITLPALCPHFHLVSSTFKWISISIMLLVSAHDAIIVNSMSLIISKFTLFPHKPNIPQTHQSISKPIQLSV